MDISNIDSGARFYRCDLHVHTPKSGCYNDKEVQPEEIVKAALAKNLDIIAITDHNSEGLYKEVAEAAKGTHLFVIPGVEITTSQGGERQIHMLALFNPDEYQAINDLLSDIGIYHDMRGQSEAISKKTIPDIMESIHRFKGIALLSHVDSESGLDYEIPKMNPTKQAILKSKLLDGIEITQHETLSKFPEHACLQSSDAHSLADIGRRYCLIKMGEPSFEGIRQALHDPDSRICLADDERLSHTSLIGMKVEGGFLDNQTIWFNKSLNCLIGGKGTGKSTIIELIRYCLGVSSSSNAIKQNHNSHIAYALYNAKVTLYLEGKNREKYRIERVYNEKPKIFRDNGEEISITPQKFCDEFFQFEVYSQNELLDIARSFKNQLLMIDQYVDLSDLLEEQSRLIRDLSKNQAGIIDKSNQINDLNSKILNLTIIREQLRVFEDQGIRQQLKDHPLWGREEVIFQGIKSCIESEISLKRDELDKFREKHLNPPDTQNLEQLPNKDLIESSLNLLFKTKCAMESTIQNELDCLINCQEKLAGIKETWNKLYDLKKEELRVLLSNLESNDVPVKSYSEYLHLEQRKIELESLAKKVEGHEKELLALTKERKSLLSELIRVRQKIYLRRKELVRRINSLLEFVRIKIEKEGDNSQYREFLVGEVLSDAKIRITKDDRVKIADSVKPLEFCDMIETRDRDKLAEKAKISADIAEKAHFSSRKKFRVGNP